MQPGPLCRTGDSFVCQVVITGGRSTKVQSNPVNLSRTGEHPKNLSTMADGGGDVQVQESGYSNCCLFPSPSERGERTAELQANARTPCPFPGGLGKAVARVVIEENFARREVRERGRNRGCGWWVGEVLGSDWLRDRDVWGRARLGRRALGLCECGSRFELVCRVRGFPSIGKNCWNLCSLRSRLAAGCALATSWLALNPAVKMEHLHDHSRL